MSLQDLNKKLADFAYVGGYTPSQQDVEELKKFNQDYVHLIRWFKHMSSFTEAERKAFAKTAVKAAAAPAACPVKKPQPPKGGDDDDDIDLFGSDDDEEAEKAKAERAKQLEAQKKGGKPGVIAKSSVVLDVKVYDDETDLDEIEKQVRTISMDGLLWSAAAKKVPLAFGIFKLQIGAVVQDAKVSIDELTEKIEEFDLVQSVDVAAFQKI